MTKAKYFEKGDVLDLIHTFNDPNADRWLVLELITSLDSRGFMRNEYVMLRKHYDVFLVDYFSKESAASTFKVVGHADISVLFENKAISALFENKADDGVKKIAQDSDSGLDLNYSIDEIDETHLYFKKAEEGND